MPGWMTAKEAMEYLRVSRATFYRLINAGKITPYQLEGTDDKRYKREELDQLLTPVPKEPADE